MAIAAGEEEPENKNKKYIKEDYNIGGVMEGLDGDSSRDKDSYRKEETRIDSEEKQLCDLSMEELNKRTDRAIEELDRERARDLVAEISRRALSPDVSAKSARANNLRLRNRITTLEQEVESLREEIKKYASKGNKGGREKMIGKDIEWSQAPQTSKEEAGMDWITMDSGSSQNLVQKYEINNIIPEVTKRVVAAVDDTLARFVERLIPLEHTVARMDAKKIMESERNAVNDNYQGSGRRGKKRRTEEVLSPVPPPDPQLNKDGQPGRGRIQSLPVDAGITNAGEKRSMMQNAERSIRNDSMRMREPNAIVVIKIKEDSELNYRVLMAELRKEINPERDLGIRKLSVHKAKSGCRIARITGIDAERQADQLVDKIKGSIKKYGDHVSVYKPGLGGANQLHFEVGGSDDTLTEDEVKKQIRESVEGREEEFKFNRFSYTARGWRMIFSCTKNKGNRLLDRGFVKVGWSRVGVRLLPKAKIRCYKCLKTGHTLGSCTEETDRGRRCFSCGNTGHSAGQCAMEAGCPLCRDLGLESTHKLGNYRCAYPSFPTRWETANNNRYGSNLTVNNRYGSNLTVNFEGGAFDGRRSHAKPGRRG